MRKRVKHAPDHVGRYELAWLIALLLGSAGLLALIALADGTLEESVLRYDRAVLIALRDPDRLADPIGPRWVEALMRDVTSLGGYTVLTIVTLVSIGFLLVSAKRHAALLLACAVGSGMLLSNLLKALFQRPRPELVPHAVEVASTSFPSGHALLSAVTYLTLGVLLARVQTQRRLKVYLLGVAVSLTLIVGASRVYLGVHYPSDVLAGWMIGAAWAMLCWLVAARLQRRGKVEGALPTV